MTFARNFSVLAISAAISLLGPGYGAAQSLSDSSFELTSSRSTGYMGLGGNLGKAIVDRHKARHAKATKPTRAEKRAAQRPRTARRAEEAAVYVPNTQSPIYLISQSLDHTGLNIGALRTHTRGP